MLDGKQLEKKLRQTWRNVLYRCTNPNDSRYDYYSKIGVDNEWKEYKNFRNDMLQGFVIHVGIHGMDNTTIDRIDNSKGYSKENCRWATWEVNRENTTRKPLPVLEKICPLCGHIFATKQRNRRYCSVDCARQSKTVPEDIQRQRKNAYIKARRANDDEFRKKRNRYTYEWHRRRMEGDPEYRKRILNYNNQWHRTHYHYKEKTPEEKMLAREKARIYYEKYRETISAKRRAKYQARKITLATL